MSHAIDAPDQKIVALIVITQQQIECGDYDGARTLLTEAIPFVLKQPEPLRSRSLAMLVESQVNVGDTEGATKTTSAIRDYPGLEKLRALDGPRRLARKRSLETMPSRRLCSARVCTT